MSRSLRSGFALSCIVLMLWQLGGAPLAHPAAAHGAGQAASAISPALAAEEESQAAGADAMPCHGHEEADIAAIALIPDHQINPAATRGTALPVSDANDGLDCCKSIGCQCACVHVSLNSAIVAVPALIVPDHPAVLGGNFPARRARIVEHFKPPI